MTKVLGPNCRPNSFHPQNTGNTTVTETRDLCIDCAREKREREKREKEEAVALLVDFGKEDRRFPKPPPPPPGQGQQQQGRRAGRA
jgi:hypothetical protein